MTLYISAQLRQPTTPWGEETGHELGCLMSGGDRVEGGESKEENRGAGDPPFSYL